ncbi:MAG: hypothetical protein K2W82_09780 [Candidatus Obscuribacterales bacterium]|nr:hypothetical protein [Candidatus Obscuribacterales bacterium]
MSEGSALSGFCDHGHHSHGAHGSGFIHHPDQSTSWSMAMQTDKDPNKMFSGNPLFVIILALVVSGLLISLPYVLDAIQLQSLVDKGNIERQAAKKAAEEQAAQKAAEAEQQAAMQKAAEQPLLAQPQAAPQSLLEEAPSAQNQAMQKQEPGAITERQLGSYYQDYSQSASQAFAASAANPFGVDSSAATVQPRTSAFQRRSQNTDSFYLQSTTTSADGRPQTKQRLVVTR